VRRLTSLTPAHPHKYMSKTVLQLPTRTSETASPVNWKVDTLVSMMYPTMTDFDNHIASTIDESEKAGWVLEEYKLAGAGMPLPVTETNVLGVNGEKIQPKMIFPHLVIVELVFSKGE